MMIISDKTDNSLVRSLVWEVNIGVFHVSASKLQIRRFLAIFSVAGWVWVPWSLGLGREGQFGVPALFIVFLEVNPEEAAVVQPVVAPVIAVPAALQLTDHAVVDGVTAVGDVEEDVDLLHVLHQAPSDGRALTLLVRPVDDPLVNVLLLGCGGQGEEEGDLDQEVDEEQHVDHYDRL